MDFPQCQATKEKGWNPEMLVFGKQTHLLLLSVSSGWQATALAQQKDFLPRKKSLQHQNDREEASLPLPMLYCDEGNHTPSTASSKCTAGKHLLCNHQNHSEQGVTEDCKTNSSLWALSASAPWLHVPQHTAFSCSLSSSQALVLPVSGFPRRLKIPGFSWTWKDLFLLWQQCHCCTFKPLNCVSRSAYWNSTGCQVTVFKLHSQVLVPLFLLYFSFVIWGISQTDLEIENQVHL